jgi:hypothetical protein
MDIDTPAPQIEAAPTPPAPPINPATPPAPGPATAPAGDTGMAVELPVAGLDSVPWVPASQQLYVVPFTLALAQLADDGLHAGGT